MCFTSSLKYVGKRKKREMFHLPGFVIALLSKIIHNNFNVLFQSAENKTSPLALLAATCSSIGRTESEKGKEVSFKTASPKMSTKSEDSRSSFKPYKQELKFPALPKPHTEGPSVASTASSTPYGYSYCHGRFPAGLMPQGEVEKERHGNCGGNPHFETNREVNLHPMVKCHPGANMPSQKPAPYPTHEHECSHCNAVRAATLPMTQTPRGSSICPCSLCVQMRSGDGGPLKQTSQLCQYQSMHNMYPHMKTPSATICRDPHCQNCTSSKFPQNTGLQNFIHPALVHQCTHPGTHPGKTPQAGLTRNGSPNTSDLYMKPKPPISGSHPFICNWVAENKHCGKSFISSEELLQHLRTHTSLSHSQSRSPCGTHETGPGVNQMAQASCNIHGCPCRLGKTSGRPGPQPAGYGPYPSSSSASLRYHPYSGLGSKFNELAPAAGSYSYLPHGMVHY